MQPGELRLHNGLVPSLEEITLSTSIKKFRGGTSCKEFALQAANLGRTAIQFPGVPYFWALSERFRSAGVTPWRLQVWPKEKKKKLLHLYNFISC